MQDPPSQREKQPKKLLFGLLALLLIVAISIGLFFGFKEVEFELLWQAHRCSYAGGSPQDKGVERDRYRKRYDAGEVKWN